jgi:hypothetical protein
LAWEIEVLRKASPSDILSTTNLTCPDLGSNKYRGAGKPATNSLSYGTALPGCIAWPPCHWRIWSSRLGNGRKADDLLGENVTVAKHNEAKIGISEL